MSVLGIVLIIILVLVLCGGLGGISTVPYGYGAGHYGIGIVGLLLIVLLILVLTNRI